MLIYVYRTPKIPGKEGRIAPKSKGILAGKKQGIPKTEGKEGQGCEGKAWFWFQLRVLKNGSDSCYPA